MDTHNDLHPQELVDALRGDVASWATGAEQSDDITMVCVEYGASPEVTGTITLPAELENLPQAMSLINEELDSRLCPLEIRHKVAIALEELFVNVCHYAYAEQDEPGKVTISYVYTPDPPSIYIELRDNGAPFNPLTRRDPTKPKSIQEAKIGGLGIFMVKKSMDEFVYDRDGDFNVVGIRKSW